MFLCVLRGKDKIWWRGDVVIVIVMEGRNLFLFRDLDGRINFRFGYWGSYFIF